MVTCPATHSRPTVWGHRHGSSLKRSALLSCAGAGGTRRRVEAAAGTGLLLSPGGALCPAPGRGDPALRACARAVACTSRPDRCRRAGFPLVAEAAAGPFPFPACAGRLPSRPPRASAPPLPPPSFRAAAARARELRWRARVPPRGRAAGLLSSPTTPHPAAPGAWGGRARAEGAGARRRRRQGFRLSGSRSGGSRGRAQMLVRQAGGGGGGGKEAACMRPTGKTQSPGRGFASRGGARRPRRGSWCLVVPHREGIF